MKVAIVGGTGNLGLEIIRELEQDPRVSAVIAIARRIPTNHPFRKAEFHAADVRSSNLTELMSGCDALIHLAWAIQPAHDVQTLHEINVMGSERVFAAAAEAGVKTILYASSVGVYSHGPKDFVDEAFRRRGTRTLPYSRHKVMVEDMLDGFQLKHPHIRVVRFRPALMFRAGEAAHVKALFMGPLIPRRIAANPPVMPSAKRLEVQAVHTGDVARAFQMALHQNVHGAFNLAADPVLTDKVLAQLLGAVRIPVPRAVLRLMASIAFHLRLDRADPGWLDLAFNVPRMSVDRARSELGWRAKIGADEALLELMDGLASKDDDITPALALKHRSSMPIQ